MGSVVLQGVSCTCHAQVTTPSPLLLMCSALGLVLNLVIQPVPNMVLHHSCAADTQVSLPHV